jgi:hypothetical protein
MDFIGNRADALIAFNHYHKDTPLPDGWKGLGEGSYRVSYLSPDRVVYKVQAYSDQGRDEKGYVIPDCNRREFEFYKEHKDSPKPEGFNITPCYLWGQRILAMPLISGQGGKVVQGWYAPESVRLAGHRWARDHQVYDVGGDNWLLDEAGILWLVDYAQ